MRRGLAVCTVGLVAFASVSTPRPARAAGSSTSINDVLGAISNAYGTFQAAEFVVSLFELGQSDEVANAVTELQSFMRDYRDQALVNNVAADLNLFRFISSNYQSGLTNDLEADFISRCINDLSQLQGDLQNGTTDDAYQLGPAYNLLTVSFVGAVKAFGIIDPANAYPTDTLNQYLTSAFSVDYSLVGAFFVSYDVLHTGYDFMIDTQGGKKMWPKYAAFFYSPGCAFGSSLFEPYYFCDNTLPSNADLDLFLGCQCVDPLHGTHPISLPSGLLSTAQNQINVSRGNFLQDQAVQAVRTSISGLLNQGFGQLIVDWDDGIFPGIGHVLLPL